MQHFKSTEYVFSLISAGLLLIAGFIINSYAVTFATDTASNSVTDIILSNTRVYNVEILFVYGAMVFAAIIGIVCFVKLEAAPFILKSLALFTVIRSFFLTLTHISPYPEEVVISPNIFTHLFPSLFTGSDLFFSGHTGSPFLLALIFWDNCFLRYVFLAFSIMFAVVVLLGHLHYTIDVAAAYFITFTIFTMSKHIFIRDWNRLKQGTAC